jgi:pilus assembly protein Flp/PilA
MRVVKRFLKSDSGATAIEYGLLASLIAVACIIAVQLLGINLVDVFTSLSDAMTGRGG